MRFANCYYNGDSPPLKKISTPQEDYVLQIAHYKLRITNYKLQITNYELRIANYELRITNYELLLQWGTDHYKKILSRNDW